MSSCIKINNLFIGFKPRMTGKFLGCRFLFMAMYIYSGSRWLLFSLTLAEDVKRICLLSSWKAWRQHQISVAARCLPCQVIWSISLSFSEFTFHSWMLLWKLYRIQVFLKEKNYFFSFLGCFAFAFYWQRFSPVIMRYRIGGCLLLGHLSEKEQLCHK